MQTVRALIVGGDSGIGKALSHALLERNWRVSSTSRHPDGRQGFHYLDLETLNGLENLPSCDHLFLCAAMTKISSCREAPGRARKINVEAPVEVIRDASSRGAHAIFLSTSAVFDGAVPRQRSEALPAPSSEYGSLKADAERILLSTFPENAVLRLTKVLVPGATVLSSWAHSLKRGEKISAFYDMFMAPITPDDVVDPLIAMAVQKTRGIVQTSASEDISYFDAAQYLAQSLDVDWSLVSGCSAVDAGIPAGERPRYTSLDTERLNTLLRRKANPPTLALDTLIRFS